MKQKTKAAQMKELRSALHYWQMQNRIERRWVRMSAEKCKEIGKKMRELQKAP